MTKSRGRISLPINLFKLTIVAILAMAFFSMVANGQGSAGVLKGTVTDENTAIIPEAKVVLRGEGGLNRDTISASDGGFLITNVPLGKYTLSVEKEGFKTVKREISLGAESQSTDLTLKPEGINETVTIVMDGAEQAVESTLKLPVSVHETPRSVSVIGSARIREQNFRQVSDFLTYVPGTTPNSYRNGSYHFYSRGYRMSPDDTRLDGFVGVNVGSSGFGASTFGIEEAVVLRGPAGLVYGSSASPGGFINLISKKPQEQRFTRIDLRGGGYSGRDVSFGERPSIAVDLDSTGALIPSGRILYRTLVTFESSNYFTQGTRDRNAYANGSLAFKLDKDGRYVLTPSIQYTRFYRPAGGGIVISPTTSLRTNDGIDSPINEDDLSSDDINLSSGRRIEKTGWAGLDFRGVVKDKLRVNANYRYISFDTNINQFTPQATTTAQIDQLMNQHTISRVQSKSQTERKYNNFSADALYEWKNAGWWKNVTQVGFYDRVLESRATTVQGVVPAAQSPVNIYTGRVLTPPQDNFPPIAFGAWGTDTIWNTFVQNRTSLDNGRWNITLGFNYGQNKPAVGSTRKSDVIPNASIVFNATPELAIYASYSTNFNPTDPDLEDVQGNRGTFNPTVGKNYEIGAKYDLLNRRVGLTFALFQNRIDNALVQSDVNVLNPRGNRYWVPAGTREARGAEVTADYQVRSDVRFSAGVSYLDAIYKGFPAGTAQSSSPIPNSGAEKSPRWSYNFYSRYDRQEGLLKGFGAGFGLFWQGKRLGSNGARTFASPDPLVLPAYMRADTALFYRLNKHVNFAFNVENLFDELIFVNASVGSSIEVAAPRTMTFRTSFNF